MDVRRLLTLPCTITRVTADGPPDDHGNPTETFTTTNTKCWLYQDRRSENERQGDQQIEGFVLVLALGTQIDGNDRVTVQGKDFEVTGPPWNAVNPRTGKPTHVEATLDRVV